jgi:hypothetical protein
MLRLRWNFRFAEIPTKLGMTDRGGGLRADSSLRADARNPGRGRPREGRLPQVAFVKTPEPDVCTRSGAIAHKPLTMNDLAHLNPCDKNSFYRIDNT